MTDRTQHSAPAATAEPVMIGVDHGTPSGRAVVVAGHRPDAGRAADYDVLLAEYTALHDPFGRGGTEVLHRLRAIRTRAIQNAAGTHVLEGAR